MAVTKLPDGRWICYYRVKTDGGKSRIKKEYFGRGPEGEVAANKCDGELGLQKRRPRKLITGPSFNELAMSYFKNKNFNANSKKHLKIRLDAHLLPFFGGKTAIQLTDQDADNYIQKRRQNPIYAPGAKNQKNYSLWR